MRKFSKIQAPESGGQTNTSPGQMKGQLKVCWLLLPQGHLVEMTPKGPGVGTIINWWPSCLYIDNAQTSTKGPWETSPPPPHHPKKIGNLWKQVNSWSRSPPGIPMPGLPIWILTKPSITGRSHRSQPEKILWLRFFCNDCTVVTATGTTSVGRTYSDPHNNLYIYMKTFNSSNLLNPQCWFYVTIKNLLEMCPKGLK